VQKWESLLCQASCRLCLAMICNEEVPLVGSNIRILWTWRLEARSSEVELLFAGGKFKIRHVSRVFYYPENRISTSYSIPPYNIFHDIVNPTLCHRSIFRHRNNIAPHILTCSLMKMIYTYSATMPLVFHFIPNYSNQRLPGLRVSPFISHIHTYLTEVFVLFTFNVI
jgi:hypothetical protein